MTLQAYDNLPNYHEKYKIVTNSRDHEYWRRESDGSTTYSQSHDSASYSVVSDIADKWNPAHSNRVRPTSWKRQVGAVVIDQPIKFRAHGYDNATDHWARTETQYISSLFGQFSFLPLMRDMDNCKSEANTEALLSLKGEHAALLGADIGQIHQTGQMLASDAIKALEVFKALKRGNLRRAASTLGIGGKHNNAAGTRAVADWWLEYNYGWKPFAKSIYDTQQLLNEQTSKDILIRGYGHGKSEGSYRAAPNGFDGEHSWKTSAKTVLYAKVQSPLLYKVSQLGVINPLSIAWDLVPWSFAVDWFVPVGNVLDALTATVGLTFDRGYTSIRSECDAKLRYNMSNRDPAGTDLIDPGNYLAKMFEFRRIPYDSFPLPSFYADLTPFSTSRILNAAALVRQLFRW